MRIFGIFYPARSLEQAVRSLRRDAPGFHRHPSILEWLHQPGATPDDRFADLVEVIRKKSHQLNKNKP